jgi:hypothetical protein
MRGYRPSKGALTRRNFRLLNANTLEDVMLYGVGRLSKALLLVAGLLARLTSAHGEPGMCNLQSALPQKCTCDIRSLRPLQGAIGFGEVEAKAAAIAAHSKRERADLEDDPIVVIRGPRDNLFIIDHHHVAMAWLLAGYSTGICQIQPGPTGDERAFWAELEQKNLVRLADKSGKPIRPDELPKSLEALDNDPYRTLAWLVRKDQGFCRSLMPQKEFAEFIWADWFRTRSDLPLEQVSASPESMSAIAFALATSKEAKSEPGFRGIQPAGFECPKTSK